jgi:lysophospholipase L1-like esterase
LNALAATYAAGKSCMKYIETYDLVFGADGLPRAELFAADKLHFNAAGYKLLAGRVRPFLPK